MGEMIWAFFLLACGFAIGSVGASRTVQANALEQGYKQCSNNAGVKALAVSEMASQVVFTCNNGATFTIQQ